MNVELFYLISVLNVTKKFSGADFIIFGGIAYMFYNLLWVLFPLKINKKK